MTDIAYINDRISELNIIRTDLSRTYSEVYLALSRPAKKVLENRYAIINDQVKQLRDIKKQYYNDTCGFRPISISTISWANTMLDCAIATL